VFWLGIPTRTQFNFPARISQDPAPKGIDKLMHCSIMELYMMQSSALR